MTCEPMKPAPLVTRTVVKFVNLFFCLCPTLAAPGAPLRRPLSVHYAHSLDREPGGGTPLTRALNLRLPPTSPLDRSQRQPRRTHEAYPGVAVARYAHYARISHRKVRCAEWRGSYSESMLCSECSNDT